MRRKIISLAIPLSGVPGRCPVKTYSLVRAFELFENRQRPARNAMRCSRPPFIRAAGTVQTLPLRAAVKIVNSSARALELKRSNPRG